LPGNLLTLGWQFRQSGKERWETLLIAGQGTAQRWKISLFLRDHCGGMSGYLYITTNYITSSPLASQIPLQNFKAPQSSFAGLHNVII